MDRKQFMKIINEEVSGFDFLGNDELLKEQELIDLLRNEDLQKQFICDSLLNKNTKIKILEITDSRVSGNWEGDEFDEAKKFSIEYFLKVAYMYDPEKEPLIFSLNFDSDDVRVSVAGWSDNGNYDTQPSGDSWFDGFVWNDIDVTLFTVDGDEIKFLAFERAPERIRTLFIREYTQNFIINQSLDIKTKDMNDKVQNISYC